MGQKQVYTTVKVVKVGHPRFGQVGNVVGASDPVAVRFADGATVNVAEVDLEGLS